MHHKTMYKVLPCTVQLEQYSCVRRNIISSANVLYYQVIGSPFSVYIIKFLLSEAESCADKDGT